MITAIIIIIIMLLIGDVDDVFLPSPSDLLANLSNCRDQVVSMLTGELSVVIIIICKIIIMIISQHAHILIFPPTSSNAANQSNATQTYPSFSTAAKRPRTALVPLCRLHIKW